MILRTAQHCTWLTRSCRAVVLSYTRATSVAVSPSLYFSYVCQSHVSFLKLPYPLCPRRSANAHAEWKGPAPVIFCVSPIYCITHRFPKGCSPCLLVCRRERHQIRGLSSTAAMSHAIFALMFEKWNRNQDFLKKRLLSDMMQMSAVPVKFLCFFVPMPIFVQRLRILSCSHALSYWYFLTETNTCTLTIKFDTIFCSFHPRARTWPGRWAELSLRQARSLGMHLKQAKNFITYVNLVEENYHKIIFQYGARVFFLKTSTFAVAGLLSMSSAVQWWWWWARL